MMSDFRRMSPRAEPVANALDFPANQTYTGMREASSDTMHRAADSPMARRSSFILIRRLSVSLVLGVMLAVGSSWTIAAVVQAGGGVNSIPSGIGDIWSYWVDRGFGTVIVKRVRANFEMKEPLRQDYLAVLRRAVPRWSAVYRSPREDEARGVTFMEDARGWPLLALSSESVITPNTAGGMHVAVRGGIPLTLSDGARARRVVLPLRPMWPRFLASVLIFSAVAFALVFGPGIARRVVRRRIGHCERCGYNLKGVTKKTVCPECGTAAAQ